MQTRAHNASIEIQATPEETFRALHTPSAIRAWWCAASAIVMPEAGGCWVATWGGEEDDPDYVTSATMRVFDPPRRIVMADYRYRARSQPLPFQAEFTTEFTVSTNGQGTVLCVKQDGFPCDPGADAFYAACEQGWHDTLANLKAYLER